MLSLWAEVLDVQAGGEIVIMIGCHDGFRIKRWLILGQLQVREAHKLASY